jgi:hypothetical protein
MPASRTNPAAAIERNGILRETLISNRVQPNGGIAEGRGMTINFSLPKRK